jgi:hypothetical protein
MARVAGFARMLLLAAALLLPGGLARADQNQMDANTVWKQASLCVQDSFKKYPDYTPDSNAKRDAARRACLRNHKLPVTGAAMEPSPPGADPK